MHQLTRANSTDQNLPAASDPADIQLQAQFFETRLSAKYRENRGLSGGGVNVGPTSRDTRPSRAHKGPGASPPRARPVGSA